MAGQVRHPADESGDPVAALATGVKAAIVLGFVLVVGIVVALPLTWGSRWAFEHFFVVVPVVALVWFQTFRLAAGRLAHRWPRAENRVVVTPPMDENDSSAVAMVTGSVRRWSRWRRVRWLVLVPGVAIAWWVISGTQHDARVAASQPRHAATVVAVDRSFPTRSGLPNSVTVALDGQRVDLWGDLPDANVGDVITVVVDPTAPDHVMDVATHTGGVYSPLAAIALGVAFGAIPVGLALMVKQPRAAERALRSAHNAEVVHFELADTHALRLETSQGAFRWVSTAWPDDAGTGSCRAVGRLAVGEWVVLVRGGVVEWPDQPLEDWASNG